MFKKIIYQIITIPFINKLLRQLINIFRPLIPLKYLIHFPVMGTLELKLEDLEFKMYSDGRDKIANGIYWGSDGFEASTLAVFQKILPHINTMLDIGANTGIYSLMALAMDNQKEVYAFEPLPEVFNYLQQNFSINHFDNAHAYQGAVGNAKGTLNLHIPQHLTLATGSSAIRWEEDWPEIEVEVITLDEFIEQQQIQSVDFIKIDVEKFEPQVIEGAQNLIQRDRPIIICEVLDNAIGEKIEAFFQDWDYCYFHIGAKEISLQTNLKANIEYAETHVERNYLLIPCEKHDLLKLT